MTDHDLYNCGEAVAETIIVTVNGWIIDCCAQCAHRVVDWMTTA